MERNLLRKDKKGVSIMLGYVLLIVLAISLSIAVYAYLKYYLPSDRVVCQDDVILSIESASCTGNNVTVTIKNRGLFTADGAFIRFGDENRIFRELLNERPNGDPVFDGTLGPGGFGLTPGEEWTRKFSFDEGAFESDQNKILEIQPFVYEDNQAALCEKAVVRRTLICSGSGSIQPGNPCGNGMQDSGEQCDDGNTDSGDGCNVMCQDESGWDCGFGAGSCTQDPDPAPVCDVELNGDATDGTICFSLGSTLDVVQFYNACDYFGTFINENTFTKSFTGAVEGLDGSTSVNITWYDGNSRIYFDKDKGWGFDIGSSSVTNPGCDDINLGQIWIWDEGYGYDRGYEEDDSNTVRHNGLPEIDDDNQEELCLTQGVSPEGRWKKKMDATLNNNGAGNDVRTSGFKAYYRVCPGDL